MINEFISNNEYREELERERRKAEIITRFGEDISGEDWKLTEGEKGSEGHNTETGYDDRAVRGDDSVSTEAEKKELKQIELERKIIQQNHTIEELEKEEIRSQWKSERITDLEEEVVKLKEPEET